MLLMFMAAQFTRPAQRHVVAISGGKDSVAMALRLRELFPGLAFEYVITPTGDELPEMVEHWAQLEKTLGPLRRLSTLTLEKVIEREGMIPNFRARLCGRGRRRLGPSCSSISRRLSCTRLQGEGHVVQSGHRHNDVVEDARAHALLRLRAGRVPEVFRRCVLAAALRVVHG